MFLGSLGVGLIPLSLSLCGSRLHMFSVFGSGLLLGTALLVIIPEGVDSLYKAMEPATKPLLGSDEHSDVHASESLLSAHQWIGLSLTLGFAWMFALDTLISILTNAPHHLHHGHTHGPCDSTEAETALFAAPPSGSASSKQRRSPTTTPTTTTTTNSHRHTHGTFTSLLSPATIGMLIHAAADGMALGMSLIIFFAILLHKAPEAFGLCTQLLQEGQSRPAIKRTLVVFALAAPLMALATYAATGLVRLGAASTGPTDDGSAAESTILMRKFTALLLLFSAGTFLYVAAVHSLPETMCNDLPEEDTCDTHHHHHHHAAHPNPAGHPHSRMISTRSSIDLGGVESDLNPAPTSGLHFTQFRRHLLKRLGVLLVGMFLPLFISLGHSH
ncbi:ZIP zinc transporter-domain-containing protein [Dimargaris cristalligena]|uniref:ZIP zinc transporter-domain-containing protein n=1 Tax=Dimargaris cristalligena TaxID=215637 RepID=A0A4P9ZS00_9FUNG|nr:ZIP zinc transporter-domain-containing protein [Dimargaris cristalligena]|eukprot:RKP36304.1 ZIP zinc transporter-domain-containing protein [Dimargaris cristalligena]